MPEVSPKGQSEMGSAKEVITPHAIKARFTALLSGAPSEELKKPGTTLLPDGRRIERYSSGRVGVFDVTQQGYHLGTYTYSLDGSSLSEGELRRYELFGKTSHGQITLKLMEDNTGTLRIIAETPDQAGYGNIGRKAAINEFNHSQQEAIAKTFGFEEQK